jgi:16S rRNA (cytidine1402-2'-O)-methyltransferase
MAGRLYLLPAGLGDSPWQATLPAQARDIACRIDYFIVENAKTARAELKRLEYPRPLREVETAEIPRDPTAADWLRLLQPVLAGRDAALMSEAGCPAVADPGAGLVRAAHGQEIRVVPLVGPSAVLLALMASGLNGQSFAFHGYLPIPETERRERITVLEQQSRRERRTQIFIETPYRNATLLDTLKEACQPATLLCVAAALTTAEEWIATRTIGQWRRAPAPAIARKPALFLLLAE